MPHVQTDGQRYFRLTLLEWLVIYRCVHLYNEVRLVTGPCNKCIRSSDNRHTCLSHPYLLTVSGRIHTSHLYGQLIKSIIFDIILYFSFRTDGLRLYKLHAFVGL